MGLAEGSGDLGAQIAEPRWLLNPTGSVGETGEYPSPYSFAVLSDLGPVGGRAPPLPPNVGVPLFPLVPGIGT